MTAQLKEDWYDPAATTFGDRLAGAREQAGMTQADLAKRLGVKLGTLKSWEDDFNEPRANKLQMLAGILNVSLSWLLTGEGEGIQAPFDAVETAGDMQELLLEIRDIRAQMSHSSDRLGRLEKALRVRLQDNAAA
ncbi:MAG: helix-turn-helix domain-containing protein [Pseudomonadota bacterium]